MKTLEIGKKVGSEYVSTFVCEIDTMLGDGDDDEKVVLAFPIDDLEELEKLLIKLRSSGHEDFAEVPNFKKFFYRTAHDDDDGLGDYCVEWPWESDCYYSYQYHQYFWYDEHGVKFEAQVVNKKAKS